MTIVMVMIRENVVEMMTIGRIAGITVADRVVPPDDAITMMIEETVADEMIAADVDIATTEAVPETGALDTTTTMITIADVDDEAEVRHAVAITAPDHVLDLAIRIDEADPDLGRGRVTR